MHVSGICQVMSFGSERLGTTVISILSSMLSDHRATLIPNGRLHPHCDSCHIHTRQSTSRADQGISILHQWVFYR
jgi:hypothetical protein